MTVSNFPHAFSEGLASPDLCEEVLGYKPPQQRLAEEIAADCGVDPGSSAYNIVIRVITRTINKFEAPIDEPLIVGGDE